MSNEVWYRKWRPQRFSEVAGQEHVTRTLVNAVASGRVSHAYLFCGPRGTGKTTTARLLAKAVNCEQNKGGEPCGHCASCRDVAEGRALDLIEMDAASNRGIDEIRSLRDKVGYSPTSSAYKVYLIDEVHELTQHAFDALLKTLEEPPPHVIFALATTEADRVPATILSRCQRFDFRRIRLADVVGRLEEICAQERVALPEGSLELIARRATGSLRDGVNLLEQVVAACGARPALEQVREALGMGGDARALALVRHALAGELAQSFELIAASRDEGVELKQLQRASLGHLRAMLLVKAGAEASLDLGEEVLAELRAATARVESGAIIRLLRRLSEADFRADPTSPLPLELALAEAVLLAAPQEREPEVPAAPRRTASDAPASVRTPVSAERGSMSAPSARPAAVRAVPEGLRGPSSRPPAPPETLSSLSARSLSPPAAEPERFDSEAAPPVAEHSTAAPPLPPESGASGKAERFADDGRRGNGELPQGAPEPARESPHGDQAEMPTITLDWAQDQMAALYDRLTDRKSRARFFVNSDCNIMDVGADSVTLTFKQDFIAAKVKTEDGGKHVQDIEDVIEALFGRRCRVRIAVDPDVKRWRRPPATPRTSHLLDEAEKLGLRRRGEQGLESAGGE